MISFTFVVVYLICSCLVVYGSRKLTDSIPPSTQADRLKKLADIVLKSEVAHPSKIELQLGYKPHNFSANAIISGAFATSYVPQDALYFVGSARRTGFTGDIVVVVLPGMTENFMKKLKDYNATVYTIDAQCEGKGDVRCKYDGMSDVPVTLLRFYAYQTISLKYSTNSYLMLSDFRDVLFQSNPFIYKSSEWRAPYFDLTVFQEAHPNRVINRDSATGAMIQNCYGKEVFRTIGSNTISSSGVIFGTRDAIASYTYLILKQVEPKTRRGGGSEESTNKVCFALGVDQGFHNFLLYTNYLHKFMRVKVFQQGEGPVNTLGGFYGEKKILKAQLSEWKILRGEAPFKYVHNWSGELSPVVHHLDRYLQSEVIGGYRSHLAVFQNV